METTPNQKELVVIKQQATKMMEAVNSVAIKTSEDEVGAATLLLKIKSVSHLITEAKEKFTKPANEIIKTARSIFNPLEKQCDEAERLVKDKMAEYHNLQEARAQKKMETIERKAVAGKLSFSEASEKIEAITPEKTIKTKAGEVQFRVERKVVIEDETKIPREYLVPDMVKIRADALNGKIIPGIKVENITNVAGTNGI